MGVDIKGRFHLVGRKIASFRRVPVADRLMVTEAILLLGLARAVVLLLPFRLIARGLSRSKNIDGNHDEQLLLRVRRAVAMASRNVPWDAVCLPQAMVAKVMLARRRCGSSFHLGVALDTQGKLTAHAWLTVGETVVVGGSGMGGMTPLARFD